MIDNTWATPLFLRPLEMGIDISLHAATKYITGHADSFLGVIVGNERSYSAIRLCALRLGQCASSEDVFLGLRGLRSLKVRMSEHQRRATILAEWLKQTDAVAEVFYPVLPTCPGHELWKRDFGGASGVFSFSLRKKFPKEKIDAMLNGLEYFGLGYSWGGFESLIVPVDLAHRSTAQSAKLQNEGALFRLQVGFESIDDLKNDLIRAFERLATTP